MRQPWQDVSTLSLAVCLIGCAGDPSSETAGSASASAASTGAGASGSNGGVGGAGGNGSSRSGVGTGGSSSSSAGTGGSFLPDGTLLGDLAASMAPGEWRALATNGIL